MNPLCQQVQVAAIVCLAGAYVSWFPFAIRQRHMPKILKWSAIALVTVAILLTAFGMPWYCQACKIR